MSDDVPAVDGFPAFFCAEIGRYGAVWILPYRRPRGELERLMGFEADGTFLRHLENSRSELTPCKFGADYWLDRPQRRGGGGDGRGVPADDAGGWLRSRFPSPPDPLKSFVREQLVRRRYETRSACIREVDPHDVKVLRSRVRGQSQE